MVEINSDPKEESKPLQKPDEKGKSQDRLDADQKRCGTKSAREKFDEIVTVKRDHVEERGPEPETIVNGARSEEHFKQNKGFSIQRAWCCLRGRRTS